MFSYGNQNYATIGSYRQGDWKAMMFMIMIIAVIICIAVIAVTALVTSKAYKVKHTVDPMPTKQEHASAEETGYSKR